jgi:hypothetical protein
MYRGNNPALLKWLAETKKTVKWYPRANTARGFLKKSILKKEAMVEVVAIK